MSLSCSPRRSIALLALLLAAGCGPAPAAPARAAEVSVPPVDSAPANDAAGAGAAREPRPGTRLGDADRKQAEALYDQALTDIAAATCPAQDPEVCAWASGFLAGERPRFGATEAWTLGTQAVVSDHGARASKMLYVILRTKRDANATWAGTFSAKPETPGEEADGRAALGLLAAGDTTTPNGFVDYIRGHLDQGSWVESAVEGKSLYFTPPGARGALMALRQRGDMLYLAQLIVAGDASSGDLRPGWVLGSASKRPLTTAGP